MVVVLRVGFEEREAAAHCLRPMRELSANRPKNEVDFLGAAVPAVEQEPLAADFGIVALQGGSAVAIGHGTKLGSSA
jgi:hypothetical protein